MATNHCLVLNTDSIHLRVNGALLPHFIDHFVVLPSEVIQTLALWLLKLAMVHLFLWILRDFHKMFIEVLGQVYRNAGMIRTIMVLAIRVINLGNEFVCNCSTPHSISSISNCLTQAQ
ncbi:hypothetical protein BT96DRAFT_941603 [Gymnopus androsaceus JB14]|uniref:Uncharacterized protein n=1 Tax=Gymnopus androsaceus JB14 TaxID=1447944 RepID=A0A6A4HHE8_9AGAR|nr:hypothetical protein BT96DRAFT_952132 [Gymnopus androsaceus JB14]KAE9396617.1 hypothetical protein BT96DRAFT_941603 [Gymnopus androsaceus JB14]